MKKNRKRWFLGVLFLFIAAIGIFLIDLYRPTTIEKKVTFSSDNLSAYGVGFEENKEGRRYYQSEEAEEIYKLLNPVELSFDRWKGQETGFLIVLESEGRQLLTIINENHIAIGNRVYRTSQPISDVIDKITATGRGGG